MFLSTTIVRELAIEPAKPPNNNLTECLNINKTLASLNYKLPDDGRRPKHVGAI